MKSSLEYSVAIDNKQVKSDIQIMTSIAIVAVPNCMFSGVIGPLEIFSIANELGVEASSRGKHPFSNIELVAPTVEPIENFTGFPVGVSQTIATSTPDVVVIPPVFSDIEELTGNTRLVEWIRDRQEAGTIVAACCAGTFLLAEAGLLDGRVATTHWRLCSDFSDLYPDVILQPELMLIDGGYYITAGGAMAWQDLALHIVSRFISPQVASKCARLLVMDGTRHTQAPYFMFPQYTQGIDGVSDPAIDIIQQWIQKNYATAVSIETLAEMVGMSSRTFLRHFKRAIGMTPIQYIQQVRIEAARHLLEVSLKNIEEISEAVGYADVCSFRKLFKRKTGIPPRAYRSKFGRIL